MKKPYWTPGNVVEIPLDDSSFSYGVVIDSPLMAFFDIHSESPVEISEVETCPILFKVWVMKYAIGKNGWKVVGQLSLTDKLKEIPWFFKRDKISGAITKYRTPEELPSTEEECRNLECAAVWDPKHIESRLVDHFAGRLNKWVESLSIK